MKNSALVRLCGRIMICKRKCLSSKILHCNRITHVFSLQNKCKINIKELQHLHTSSSHTHCVNMCICCLHYCSILVTTSMMPFCTFSLRDSQLWSTLHNHVNFFVYQNGKWDQMSAMLEQSLQLIDLYIFFFSPPIVKAGL